MIKSPDENHHRYSRRPFPAYRFVPGENPHPIRDPNGHSYRQCIDDPGRINPDKFYENDTYLFGVDLFNYAFWWESHEAFESLWKPLSKDDSSSHFLQGLIKISAAFLKWHARQQRGLEIHYRGGIAQFQRVLEISTEYMGINLINHIDKTSNYFREVMAPPHEWPNPRLDYPFISLEFTK